MVNLNKEENIHKIKKLFTFEKISGSINMLLKFHMYFSARGAFWLREVKKL
ncbi:membrane protein [Clostridium acetobutylicum EA 2018]|nr:membrane protein [Clostridium acetobutylicum EA 2018]AEI31787.1 membrane protein [Clostridium acetobutylicum DSM 1731]